ncbi:MAG TPA: hypothetical protein VNO32_32055, partial [Candidatus Acidoferrum sp.]|nr:hypothetical protein [Candidatus Acidoferrum sp.]
LRCKRAQSSTRIRRGDREVGFVAHKYWELTVPLVAGGTAVGLHGLGVWDQSSTTLADLTPVAEKIAVRRGRRFRPSFESDQDEV